MLIPSISEAYGSSLSTEGLGLTVHNVPFLQVEKLAAFFVYLLRLGCQGPPLGFAPAPPLTQSDL